MAMGIDIICAEEVLALRGERDVSLKCVIPYHGQEKGWRLKEQQRYKRILEASGDILILSAAYTKDCFMARNRYLTENAGFLIAAVSNRRSGTGATIRLAEKLKREVIYINIEGE
jgi:uncharacterized phage-like protein YoqJ